MAAAVTERIVRMETEIEKPVKFTVRAAATVRRRRKEDVKGMIANQIDAYSDKIGRNVVLELISTEIDPRTGAPRTSKRAELKGWFEKKDTKAEHAVYTAEFTITSAFGEPGAIAVLNRHHREFYLESIVVEGFGPDPIHFTCSSWVQPTRIHPNKRIFFTNKPYLPSETPPGLRMLREKELRELRGDGTGERKLTDRVYDFATYNDLGNPDKGAECARPLLGGEDKPYPRRMRTGRPPASSDARAESRVEYPVPVYVPRDEAFEEGKEEMLSDGALKALLHNLVPSLVASISSESIDFKGFHEVDNLFKEGIRLKQTLQDQLLQKIPVVSKLFESGEALLRYDNPHILTKDKFAWLRDDEFARQTLAGINPINIERLQAFPPVSQLDPAVYGPPESAIKEEHIAGHLDGMSVQQAIAKNKLYILDYHDIYLPFLDQINAQDGRKAYGTRTIFFLTSLGTLKPTHACIEPFIIAAHRQLSAMHPIYKLLKPHMRYTLEINAIARQILISGDGVIESGFTPGRYCVEMSAAAYRDHWRFDQEGLPADLIRRGMAVEDPTQPHGLRLLIEDYPYATDGLLLWSAIERWVHTYVSACYPSVHHVQADTELQSWYAESIHSGHPDKRHAPWWPRLSSPADVASFLTTLIWLASAQHAALNFGQYPLGGYVPCRPPLMRRLVPIPGDPEFENLTADPHRFFLSALPSLTQATTFMTVIDTLSTHSADEEYLGERPEPDAWTGDAAMVRAAREFAADVRRAEEEMSRRNSDPQRRNRCGAGVLPYELMAPSSTPGITCRGVPNSVTI
ncbi:putative lipoxygenase 5 [Ananas comosus]|uniref:Lipoxygenase n=1 Tax=Ananas comosus TaxID=4615 RepID=A0A199V0C4_ANACO|nr:putative lipoxygenase 5 [Ananas comosus]